MLLKQNKILSNEKTFLIIIALFAFTVFTNAQEFHFGAKAGVNLGKVTGTMFKNGSSYGFQAGAFLEYDFNEKFGVQPELLFNQINTTPENDQHSTAGYFMQAGKTINLNYVSLPVLLRINTTQLLTVQVGPEFSKMISGNPTYVSNGRPEKALKTNDVAGVLGLQLNLQKWTVDARYELGLSNINSNSQYISRTRKVALNLGYRIF